MGDMAGTGYERQAVGKGVYKLLRRSDGAWVSTQVFYRSADRKQRVKTFAGPDTLTAAKKFKADVDRKDVEQRPDPNAGRSTLGEMWDEMVSTRDYAEKTLRSRAEIRGKAGLADLFATRLDRISRDMVAAAIAKTTEAPGMAREIHKALSATFSYAMKAKGIELPRGNPAAGLGMKSTRAEAMAARGEEVKRVLSREELQRLISETPDRYKALIELLGRVGLRPGEAYGLRVRQVDAIGNELRIDGLTKTWKTRTIPIDPGLSATLWTHLERYSDPMDPEALVFPTETGKVIDEHNWRRRVFQPASERAGVNHGLRPYDLRHTALSTALSLGIDPATVANMAGHDVRTLLSTYTHSMEDAKVRAAKVLGEAWATGG